MKKFLLLPLIAAVSLAGHTNAAKVGDEVDLTPTIKGYVVKVNGTNHDVEIYANPDNKPTGDLTIPYFYSNASSETFVPVRITSNGFKGCELTSVTVGAGIEYIGNSAFYGCTKLKSFKETSAGTVKSVGSYAFYHTYSLESISLIGVYTLNEYAFNYSGIKSANFPNLEYLYAAGFYECNNLETFTGGENLKMIDNIAFCKCEKLKRVDLGPNVKSMGSMAFAFCEALKEIVIPENCSNIAANVFQGIALSRTFILNPDCMNWLDQSSLVRDKALTEIYCLDNLVSDIKYYISTGSETNPAQFLASQAQVLPLSDLVEMKQIKDDEFQLDIKYNDISAISVFNPETGSEIRPSNGIYSLSGDKVGLQYRVDWKNLLRYTAPLDRMSSVDDLINNDTSIRTRYFDLQGREVTNPSNGIFIQKKNGKVRKVML